MDSNAGEVMAMAIAREEEAEEGGGASVSVSVSACAWVSICKDVVVILSRSNRVLSWRHM